MKGRGDKIIRRTYTEKTNWGFGISVNFPKSVEIVEEIIADKPRHPQLTAQAQPKALSAPPGKTLGVLICPVCGHHHNPLDLVNDDGIIANGDVDCQGCGRSLVMECKMEYVFDVRGIG